MKQFTLYHGDCLVELKKLQDNSIDSCVTDPPYGINFMAKSWDYDIPKKEIWKEVFRVLKPGAHLLSFFGTKTYHRGVIEIEDAGFEIRDMIQWIYGQGFPKSHDISKAIDKTLGAQREIVGIRKNPGYAKMNVEHDVQIRNINVFEKTTNKPVTDEAKEFDGWGTALKPAQEPIVLARKPLSEDTVAKNVLKYKTGALNIDGSRISMKNESTIRTRKSEGITPSGWKYSGRSKEGGSNEGRFPSNLIHDGSDEVTSLFPKNKSGVAVQRNRDNQVHNKIYGAMKKPPVPDIGYNDEGSVARFFYCAKTSISDREEGLDVVESKLQAGAEFRPYRLERALNDENDSGDPYGRFTKRKNNHPTVKPTDLMRYLCRMITPPNGIVLDPFMGSGSTGKAAIFEGFDFVGIEMNKDYFDIAQKRIEYATKGKVATLEEFFQ